MMENTWHKEKTTLNPPPQRVGSNFAILNDLKESYKIWHSFLNRLPRATRYTLGTKIDNYFTNLLELTLVIKYAKREDKIPTLEQLGKKMDMVKYFVTLLWELKAIDNNKYSQLAIKLGTVGKMLGQLLKNLKEGG